MIRDEKTRKITFHYTTSRFTFNHRQILKQNVVYLFKKEKLALNSLTYVFCDDRYLLKINQDFLKHDDLTDIITFTLSTNNAPVVGEIYISIERVKENARIFKVAFGQELARVVFHGALHLCGYRDKNKADKLAMRIKEEECLAYHSKTIGYVPRGTNKQ